ncbi:N-acetylmuramic acid 6-phosphate etherase [Mediterraneibacter sp. NSJ-55]|uniref:N-acetylmuramic acid 6-phosphate etherase n=1 Tax=Mediterraneibacter hominis TaxID=2763054 RepID=A0A923RR95_9FIRM|nr:N-acetylmuramic acid 6-phosphate etherase [Mediterraneibacter hominis]MBC5690346.1 N-acetylmuramic acid 6-phosphate etherase [Mediterraneibacter hominis]
MDKEQIGRLSTEVCNPRSRQMDRMEICELLTLMNEEDEKAVQAVKEALPEIERAVKEIICALKNGGRLIYVGAGTSGRMGVMDAVECVPTFSTTDEVIAIMAGGEGAFVRAVEGAEDSQELAVEDLRGIGLKKEDVVLAIAASGRTPYCIGALKEARKKKARCMSLACNHDALISQYADVAIEVDAGPEVLTGSTRLKAGTCQKLILNMISTTAMVGIGKVYNNYMVDMKATNYKLADRAKRIVMECTQCSEKQAEEVLKGADGSIKTAVVMLLTGVTRTEAEEKLKISGGFVNRCI